MPMLRHATLHTAARRRRRANGALSALGALLTAVLALACAGTPERSEPCRPAFPYTQGWLGGDAAYSVALDAFPADATNAAAGSRRTLWLFGDTFVGEPGSRDRREARLVHNSIGISRCGATGFEITYHLPRASQPDGQQAFFEAPPGEVYWWPFAGVVYAGRLYVGLLEVRAAPAQEDPLGLPFELVGMKIARVANPDAPPSDWQIDVRRLSETPKAFPGAAFVREGEYLYLFAWKALAAGRQPRFLARIPLSRLAAFSADLARHVETLDAEGTWIPGLRPERAKILLPDNGTEMSVEYYPRSERWLAVYASPLQTGDPGDAASPIGDPRASGTVYARTAERLTGPWSQRIALYRYPELEAAEPAPGAIPFCYGAKGHRAFASSERLLLTYICNLRSAPGEPPWPALRALQVEMNLYRPRTVYVDWPAAGSGPSRADD